MTTPHRKCYIICREKSTVEPLFFSPPSCEGARKERTTKMADPFLKRWDSQVAPHLGRIEDCAASAEYYLDQILNALLVLRERPSFTTKAEAALESLDKKIKVARNEYLSKPMEKASEGKHNAG